MKKSKKLWTFGIIGLSAISIIPLSIGLVSCGNKDNDESNNNLINENFANDIKDPNKTIEGVNQNDYDRAKYIFENYDNKFYNFNVENPLTIAQNWLNNATTEQIENLLFINFNRNIDFYNNSDTGTFVKSICTISNVNYNSNTHNVSFVLREYKQDYSHSKYWDLPLEIKNSYILEYKINNMKLIINQDSNSQYPQLTIDVNDINIELTNATYNHDFEYYNQLLKLLDKAKELGFSYEGQIVEGQYYETLKNVILSARENMKKYIKIFSNTKGINWDKDWFYNDIEESINGDIFKLNNDYIGFNIEFINNLQQLVKNKLYRSTFLIFEYNKDKSDFYLINN